MFQRHHQPKKAGKGKTKIETKNRGWKPFLRVIHRCLWDGWIRPHLTQRIDNRQIGRQQPDLHQ